MGLFSTKYKTQVGTAVSRVIDDDALPGAVKKGSLKALFSGGELTEYVMEELVASIAVRAERMYAYAENTYTHGLPSGEVYSATQGRQQVEAVIESTEGQQVLMRYSYFGSPNTLHIGWMKLIADYGYSPETNQLAVLTALKGTPVYLKDMVVVVPSNQIAAIDEDVLQQWGTAARAGYTPEREIVLGDLSKPSLIVQSSAATEMHLKVTYTWKVSSSALVPLAQESLTISVSEYPDEADYFQAKYTVGGVTKYWMYRNNAGLYPTLDGVFSDAPVVNGSYFPFIYFRYNKASVSANKTTEAYKTSKRMMKYLGADYDVLAEAIDENPDIADVEQAMLTMAVPAVSEDPIECRYLFEYFDAMYFAMADAPTYNVDLGRKLLFRTSTDKNISVIKDKLFRMALANSGIYKQLIAGSIGDVGSYSSSYQVVNFSQSRVSLETGETVFYDVPTKTHKYRHQVAPGLYEEIWVTDLRMVYYIFEDYTTTGDETDDILLIPIDREISKNYSITDREVLYARSLHFVFNSRVVTKVKWYQTGVFKVILIIAAAVISLYDGGWTLATILTTAGIQALIVTIIVTMIVGELFAVAFRLFVKLFGADIAMIIAIVAILYGGYQVLKHGSVVGAPFASELLMLSSGLSQEALSAKMGDLMGEAEAFRLLTEEKNELLKNAEDLLDTTSFLSPFVIFGEKPEDFYNRTVHSGNIGTLGITAISSYVDIALTLPKLNDTVGEEIYAV